MKCRWSAYFFLSTTATLLLIGCRRYPPIRPVVGIIADGRGAELYFDRNFEANICRAGKKGFNHLMKLIDSNPPPDVMAVCLRTMSHFNRMYFRISGETIENDERMRILQTLYRLMRSERKEYVRLVVTHYYYHFDLWDQTIVDLLRELAKSDDEQIQKFAQLSLEKTLRQDPPLRIEGQSGSALKIQD